MGAMCSRYRRSVNCIQKFCHKKGGHEISSLDVWTILELIFRRTLLYLAQERCVVANTVINCLDS